MPASADLHLHLHNYWYAGTGLTAGSYADALTDRTGEGLPRLSGRHIKGLLRHALLRAESWQWLQQCTLPPGPAASLTELLAGSADQSGSRFETRPGMLIVDDAGLPPEEADWLAPPDQAPLREALFSRLFNTAIDQDGCAKDSSLRSTQVCLPVMLIARLQLDITASEPELRAQQHQWLQGSSPWAPLNECLTLIDAVGGKRTRGLGEARLELVPRSGDPS